MLLNVYVYCVFRCIASEEASHTNQVDITAVEVSAQDRFEMAASSRSLAH